MATTRPPAKPRTATRKPAARPSAAKAPKAKAAAPKPDKLEGTQPTARKTAARKPAAVKPATASKPAAKSAAKPAPRRRKGLIAAIAVGLIATGSALALFGRRLLEPGNAEHEAPDLALDHDRYGSDPQRAPEAFRPDPTAEVPANEREALRPAPLVH